MVSPSCPNTGEINVKTMKKIFGLAAVAWVLAMSVALAQRIQFVSQNDGSNPATGAPATTAPPVVYSSPPATSPYGTPAAGPTPAPGTTGPMFVPPNTTAVAPGTMVAPGPTTMPGMTPQPGSAPIYTPPAGTPGMPATAPPGAAQLPGSNWDSYGTPGCTPCGPQGSLMSQDPYLATTPNLGAGFSMATMQKFLQHIDLSYDWFVGHGDRELGINDVGLSATFAFFAFRGSSDKNRDSPFLVTPGFAVHYWEGPVSLLPPPDPADLPARTYDAYIDAAWNPWIDDNRIFGVELDFRTGVYSDFNRVTSDSIRFMGKGLAVLRFSPSMTLKGGIWYLDRVKVKLLPAGGLCWTPNADVYFDILFPNPEFGRRLSTVGGTEWWLYGRGIYGGGTWTIKRDTGFQPPMPMDGKYDRFDYNDIEVAVGVRFKTLRQFNGYVEGGISCSRELIYKSGDPPAYYPRNTFFLGAGMSY
jgi:hypothetical protein